MSILQMSISAGLLVIAVVLIRAVALNRLPKKMFLILWGVALLRLLIPVSIPLPFSIPNVFVKISEVLRTVLLDSSVLPVINNPVNTGETVTGITETAGNIAEASQERFFNITPTTAIWLVGMLALFIFFAVIYFRNHREIRYATVIRDNDFLNQWLTENRLTRLITIMQSDRIISPLAIGIFKPQIILPKSMNTSDKQLLDIVLTHEYYHIKRFDALWKIVLLLALCVHWFNPMVWVMFVLVSRDLELICDEAVIYRFGAKIKKTYAYMLIGMAEQQGKFAPIYNGFSKNATEERIVSIMKTKKTTNTAIILAVLLVIGATTVFASSALTSAYDSIFTSDGKLKSGKYIHNSGDPDKYIEVYDDGTLEIYGLDFIEWRGDVNDPNPIKFDERTEEDKEYIRQWVLTMSGRKKYGIDSRDAISIGFPGGCYIIYIAKNSLTLGNGIEYTRLR